MRILCNHEYALSSIFSYRSRRENKRYHEIVLVCNKCHNTNDWLLFPLMVTRLLVSVSLIEKLHGF